MGWLFASSSALEVQTRQRAEALRRSSAASQPYTGTAAPIRRPYRGIQIKDDTYATMQIVDAKGISIPLVSESSTDLNDIGQGQVNVYADFIIQQITEERVEKQQIIETFGDSFIYFFGERPRVLTIQGVLMNTEDFGWRAQFMHNYENHLRGSKLVQKNARMFLSWDTVVISGYPINVSASESADNPYLVNFQMQIFLTSYQDFGRIGVVQFPNSNFTIEELDALNRDLSLKEAYISTTSAVRFGNLISGGAGGGGLAATIREGVKGVNNLFGIASAFIQDVSTTLSGRVIRKPVGIAAFIDQVGSGSSINAVGFSADVTNAFAILEPSLRILVPARSKFAVPPADIFRTRISLNYDEYPLYESFGAEGILGAGHSLGQRDALAAKARQESLTAALDLQESVLTAAATIQETEATILAAISDVISLTRTGFAIVNTVANADGGAVALDALGLSGITTFG